MSLVLEKESPVIENVQAEEMRTVVLVAAIKCGCGYTDMYFRRQVPVNSSLQDGDRITEKEVLPTDELTA